MHSLSRWIRRTMAVLLCLVALTWAYEEASQWLLRWRGEQLLAQLKRLQVGSSSATAEAFISTWSKRGTPWQTCDGVQGQTCHWSVRISHILPSALRGDSDRAHQKWLARLTDHTGLRSSVIVADMRIENGLIIQKSFAEIVELPIRDWYVRGGAYVPDLAVGSTENTASSPYSDEHIDQAHPFRYARRLKGPYGLSVVFTPSESPSEREKLMNFRFSCITNFIPCNNEREILPEGARLLGSAD